MWVPCMNGNFCRWALHVRTFCQTFWKARVIGCRTTGDLDFLSFKRWLQIELSHLQWSFSTRHTKYARATFCILCSNGWIACRKVHGLISFLAAFFGNVLPEPMSGVLWVLELRFFIHLSGFGHLGKVFSRLKLKKQENLLSATSSVR